MNFIDRIIALILILVSVSACEDVFVTDTDDTLPTGSYISKDDEMYKGFLGIMTKVQQAADHAIFLTDTRSDYFEVTGNAPLDLRQIYSYESTQNNPYADPTCYYAVIVACNDFVEKMRVYRNRKGEDMEELSKANADRLVSSALRIKVWAYLTLGRIYGEAVWFDDPLVELIDLGNSDVFTHCEMPQLVEKCLALLDNGVVLYEDEVIPSTLEMEWGEWINAENPTNNYDHWDYIVPQWLLLRCDLLAWRGTDADYLWIRDHILDFMYSVHTDPLLELGGWYYACNIPLMTGGDNIYNCEYYKMFYTEQYNAGTKTNLFQVISGVMYDYDNEQTNRIVEYFCPEGSGKYYLRPSSHAIQKYAESDTRGFVQRKNMNVIAGDTCFTKYYYYDGSYLRNRIVEIQPVIPIYRGHDYHFLLSEAENHLGNWEQAEVILNHGVTNQFANKVLPAHWHPKYGSWFGDNGGYGDVGIVGCVRGAEHPLPKPTDPGYVLSETDRRKVYDLALLDEALLEYAGEGKAYSMMVRMAEKYNDPSIVADRVCPKYPESMRDGIRSILMNKGYWVEWDLQMK